MIPVNAGAFSFPGGEFRPTGSLAMYPVRPSAPRRNPWLEDFGPVTLGARLVVGFSVGNDPRWTLDDLVAVAQVVLDRHLGDPSSSSFGAQRGIYRHRDGGHIITEDSGQVLVYDAERRDRKAWENLLLAVAEDLGAALDQESVLLDLQENGIGWKSGLVGPREGTRVTAPPMRAVARARPGGGRSLSVGSRPPRSRGIKDRTPFRPSR